MTSIATDDPKPGASLVTDPSTKAKEPAKTEEPDLKQTLSPQLVDIVVAELRYQTAFYLEAVQAMMDGVTLGAERVQDKQIELAQAGPITDTGADILTFVLTIVLNGTVGPAIAAFAVRGMLRPLISATAKAITFYNGPNMGKLVKDIRLYRYVARASEKRANYTGEKDFTQLAERMNERAKELLRDSKERRVETKELRKTLSEATRIHLIAIAKGVLAGSSQQESKQAPIANPSSAVSSPGIEVRSAAMESASNLRMMVIATHEALEVKLKDPATTLGEVSEILTGYRVDWDVNPSLIRETYDLATEAMIWAKLILNDEVMANVTARAKKADSLKSYAVRGEVGGYHLSGDPKPKYPVRELHEPYISIRADPRLTTYLTSRFGRETERWATENEKYVPIVDAINSPAGYGSKRDQGWFSSVQMKPEAREDLLVQFLTAVAKGTPPEFKLKNLNISPTGVK